MEVAEVYIWSNGMVMAFDVNGNQVCDCQGFVLDIAEKLKERCNADTKWNFAKRSEGTMSADFSWWWKCKVTGRII